jgi:hypothetical protein
MRHAIPQLAKSRAYDLHTAAGRLLLAQYSVDTSTLAVLERALSTALSMQKSLPGAIAGLRAQVKAAQKAERDAERQQSKADVLNDKILGQRGLPTGSSSLAIPSRFA